MKQLRDRGHRSGFTLIELMIVVAVIAVIAVIAAPSMRSMMQMQRLRGINAQLVTDLQYARNEAVSRNVLLRVSFRSAANGLTCYTLFTAPEGSAPCDCRLGPGLACPANMVEVRTVQVPSNLEVTVSPVAGQNTSFAFDPITGGLFEIPQDQAAKAMDKFVVEAYLDNARKLHTILNRAGRPTVCTPAGSTMTEQACP